MPSPPGPPPRTTAFRRRREKERYACLSATAAAHVIFSRSYGLPPRSSFARHQIVHLGLESENIDDVDRMAKPAQLLFLRAPEGSGARSLRTRIHVGDRESS